MEAGGELINMSKRDPIQQRAAAARWWEKLKEDPVRLAAHNEKVRQYLHQTKDERNAKRREQYPGSAKQQYTSEQKYIRKTKMREWFQDYKATCKCRLCDENHPACLDFHHTDPDDKGKSVGTLVSQGQTIERVKAEIDKCEVLCANCHRKQTYAGQRHPAHCRKGTGG